MSNGKVVRQNVELLSAQELAALRNGYSRMQGISDNRGFNYNAGFHGVPGHYCHNEVPYRSFLLWHRAYLYWFEQYLRDQDNTLGIPWWDWTSNTSRQIGIPSAFSSPNTENNQRNALYSSHINVPSANPSIDRDTFRSPGNPGDLPTPDVLASLLQITDFLQFSYSLENYPHNFIHGWVGGDMGLIAYSAYDPIFYSHHCMIDRIWYLWQLQHGNSTIPPDLLSQPLAPFNLTGAAVLRVEDLGYEYVVDQVTVISGK